MFPAAKTGSPRWVAITLGNLGDVYGARLSQEDGGVVLTPVGTTITTPVTAFLFTEFMARPFKLESGLSLPR